MTLEDEHRLLSSLLSCFLRHEAIPDDLLTGPIGRLSASLEQMTSSRQVESRLPLTGSSREVDALTQTFNALMASLASAEAQTEAAYAGAIQALATALDHASGLALRSVRKPQRLLAFVLATAAAP